MPETEVVYDPNLPMAFVGGECVPTGKKPVTAAEIMDGLRSELASDYEGSNPAKVGLTKVEAIQKSIIDAAADGNLEAAKMLHDRVLGKPIQQVQSLTINTSWKEFLDGLKAAREGR